MALVAQYDLELSPDLDTRSFSPDERTFRQLACAVIFRACKDLRGGSKKDAGDAEAFFFGEGYQFWSDIAGLRVDGPTIMRSVRENGICDTRYYKHFLVGEEDGEWIL